MTPADAKPGLEGPPRRYTLAEIDAMRELVSAEMWPSCGGGYAYPMDPAMSAAIAQREYARSAQVEDRLRTYMLAGIGPDDLRARAAQEKGE